MELWLPEQIDLDETSNALMADVGETARRVHELRPLPQAVLKRIEDDLWGERVYSSNAIEGNTLDLRETVMILRTGKISGGRKREAREARNLGHAVKRITEWVDTKESCHTGEKLREVHAILFREINDEWGGRYRDRSVMIQGATRQPPDETLVSALMERLLKRLAQPEDSNSLLLGTWAHWRIARIHPFYDGNGRMARLWQDLVLLRGGLTCAIIRPQDRREYLEALGSADEGDFNPLVQLVAQRVSLTFDRHISALREDEEVVEWTNTLVGEADARLEERRKLSYLRWSRKMERLRLEFEICASRINDASRDVQIEVRKYDLIGQSLWENLKSGLGGGPTWLFSMDFSCKGGRRRYYFFLPPPQNSWVPFRRRTTRRPAPRAEKPRFAGRIASSAAFDFRRRNRQRSQLLCLRSAFGPPGGRQVSGAGKTSRFPAASSPPPPLDTGAMPPKIPGLGAEPQVPTHKFCGRTFFFGKHFWAENLDTEEDRSEGRVSLLVSEDSGNGEAVRLDCMDNCPLALREVFVVGDHFIRKRFDRTTSGPVYDRDIPPLKIAQDFIAEVFLHRLT